MCDCSSKENDERHEAAFDFVTAAKEGKFPPVAGYSLHKRFPVELPNDGGPCRICVVYVRDEPDVSR